MSKYGILKAVEYSKCAAKWKKEHPFDGLLQEGWLCQPKYDGCFGMAVFEGDSKRMLSRTGEDYTVSCQAILDELDVLVRDDCIVLGEVWHPTLGFPAISGQMRRHQLGTDLQFVCCDYLPLGFRGARRYSERLAQLGELLGVDEHRYLTHMVHTEYGVEDAKAAALTWKNRGGFDGCVLRDPNAYYSIGDAKYGEIIKVKPVLALDLAVVGWSVMTGPKTGRDVYTVKVNYLGQLSDVGSGIPHDYIPKVGDIVEVECMGLTADGKLREPRFKGVRFDKDKPD